MKIVKGSIEDIVEVLKGIPEFVKQPSLKEIGDRLGTRPHLILIAKHDQKKIGFKIGYEESTNTLYSWLGGVIPKFRQLGAAQRMLDEQESWALKHGYEAIKAKSMNEYPAMLILLIKNGYSITQLEKRCPSAAKIVFHKTIL